MFNLFIREHSKKTIDSLKTYKKKLPKQNYEISKALMTRINKVISDLSDSLSHFNIDGTTQIEIDAVLDEIREAPSLIEEIGRVKVHKGRQHTIRNAQTNLSIIDRIKLIHRKMNLPKKTGISSIMDFFNPFK